MGCFESVPYKPIVYILEYISMTDCWVSHTCTNITEVNALCIASCVANWQPVNQHLATPKTKNIFIIVTYNKACHPDHEHSQKRFSAALKHLSAAFTCTSKLAAFLKIEVLTPAGLFK